MGESHCGTRVILMIAWNKMRLSNIKFNSLIPRQNYRKD